MHPTNKHIDFTVARKRILNCTLQLLLEIPKDMNKYYYVMQSEACHMKQLNGLILFERGVGAVVNFSHFFSNCVAKWQLLAVFSNLVTTFFPIFLCGVR